MHSQTDIGVQLVNDLLTLGVHRGGVLLMHSSLSSLGYVDGGAETVIQALLQVLGRDGTLLIPALSYETVTRQQPVFNLLTTPSCIGAIPEYFRTRPGTQRSMHPTHSVCGVGAGAAEILGEHILDRTPVGPHSPFHKLPDYNGQILMLGCGLNPNTSMHGIEELSVPPYLYGSPVDYTLINESGASVTKMYTPHNFREWVQCYDRIANYMREPDLKTGKICDATAYLIDARALWDTANAIYKSDPLAFVARKQGYTGNA